MSSRSSCETNVLTSASLICSVIFLSASLALWNSVRLRALFAWARTPLRTCTLCRASSALASSKSKNLSSFPKIFCREIIAGEGANLPMACQ